MNVREKNGSTNEFLTTSRLCNTLVAKGQKAVVTQVTATNWL